MGETDLPQEAVMEVAVPPEKRTWYRRVMFQATVVGACAFLYVRLQN